MSSSCWSCPMWMASAMHAQWRWICGGCLEVFEAHSYSADRSCAQQARRGVVLDFAKRAFAAVWACFVLSFVNDLMFFDVVKRILAAVWEGFAPSGLMKVRCCISQNVFWLKLCCRFEGLWFSKLCSRCSLGRFCAQRACGGARPNSANTCSGGSLRGFCAEPI